MDDLSKLKDKIASFPDAPGVYLMKDSRGRVIYVGKAKSLRKRLSSYMGRGLSGKTAVLISKVSDIECRLTSTESLALLIEWSLVHKYKPRYNVSLRDDKRFPLVKISKEEFPAICIVRKREEDGACYFGPYTNAGLLRDALKIIRRYFPYRSCRRLPKKACIYYRIGLSPAPCIGKIGKKEYAKTVEKISLILEGKTDALIRELSRQMRIKSKKLEYEEAAKVRDEILALSVMGQGKAGVGSQAGLGDLKEMLHLDKMPQRIEAFDISNISGRLATGSMVSFYAGSPDKGNYRRFRIKTVEGIDDYKMLSEVIYRRYSRLMEERLPMPDLILIDGGRAHLSVAEKTLDVMGLNIPLVAIAKEQEKIYTKDREEPVQMDSDTPALNLIRRIRDEAHRFAVSYHRVLRRKKIIGR